MKRFKLDKRPQSGSEEHGKHCDAISLAFSQQAAIDLRDSFLILVNIKTNDIISLIELCLGLGLFVIKVQQHGCSWLIKHACLICSFQSITNLVYSYRYFLKTDYLVFDFRY